jgi:ribonuclease D
MSDSDPVYIDRPAALERLMGLLLEEPAIALDTEANSMFAFRERTCLVQIATRRRTFLVDPLAPLDLRPLAPVLADPAIVKVLHGAEFDVLMLKRAGPFEIAGLFDTRVAAASLGLGSSSLAALVAEVVGVELDKRYQRSDWGERPLSVGQRRYAAQDVCYLLEVADELRARLHDAGFPHPEEVAAECRRIEGLEPAPPEPLEDRWSRIKGAQALDGLGRRTLAVLDRWRQDAAKRRDVPPFKILGNDVLLRLAAERPRAGRDVAAMLPPRLASRLTDRILDLLDDAEDLGPLARPRPASRDDRLPPDVATRHERLKAARRREAELRSTDPTLVLPKALMESLARAKPTPDTEDDLRRLGCLERWRIEHAGAWILEALRGGGRAAKGSRGPRRSPRR